MSSPVSAETVVDGSSLSFGDDLEVVVYSVVIMYEYTSEVKQTIELCKR
jgi:hypothetical protein